MPQKKNLKEVGVADIVFGSREYMLMHAKNVLCQVQICLKKYICVHCNTQMLPANFWGEGGA